MYDVRLSRSASVTKAKLTKAEYQSILKNCLYDLQINPVPPDKTTRIDGLDGDYFHTQSGRVTIGYEVDHGTRTVTVWCFLLDGPQDIIDAMKGLVSAGE